jgi:hypothetical protein
VTDDGSELEFGPGDVVAIPPGHDGLVVGNEPCVVVECLDRSISQSQLGNWAWATSFLES